ncbi:MAG: Hsp20/alpha crystallin family protein [Mycobacteriaceae bacterium]|nr:Hsp20/alpha crystallin family protein [Mycobacteriaceae bacterium]
MMATLPVQRQPRALIPDLAELFTASPLFAGLRPLFDRNLLRLEEETKGNHYEVRAEIPGIDPANDIDITVRDKTLTIKAVRSQKAESNGRSEFAYGAFVRSVPLPAGANPDDITATYDKGILTVSVPVPDGAPVAKRIEVQPVN